MSKKDEEFNFFDDYLEKTGLKEKKKEGKKKPNEIKIKSGKVISRHEKISIKDILIDAKETTKENKDVAFFLAVEVILTIVLILMLIGIIPMF